MPINDTLNAFVAHGRIEVQTTTQGPLAGLTFAVKDFYDIKGIPALFLFQHGKTTANHAGVAQPALLRQWVESAKQAA